MNRAILVIIPTYNERANLAALLDQILTLDHQIQILIVDDNSPDRTSEIVLNHQEFNRRIFLIQRPQKMGLGTAYVDGFKWAKTRSFRLICQMDADFSHDPQDLESLIHRAQHADLVLGSRYLSTSGKIEGWPIHRLLLSFFANLYARILLRVPIRDLTGGFKCFNRNVLMALNVETLSSEGYAFQIETTMRAYRAGLKIVELPITFRERELGVSKMSKSVIREAFWKVIKLAFIENSSADLREGDYKKDKL